MHIPGVCRLYNAQHPVITVETMGHNVIAGWFIEPS
jgi:hypothetical protein